MKLALFADIHSNLEALTACLGEAMGRGADAYAFVGDLVGYGADPARVVEIVADYAAHGAVVVQGNHDAAVVAGDTATMRDSAAAAVEWTRAQLDSAQREFLARMPLTARQDDLFFVHASADRPAEWEYVHDPTSAQRSLAAAGEARYVFSGHVHEPALYYTSAAQRPVPFTPVPNKSIPVPPHRRWLAIVGSTGQPRDGNTAACWAMLDLGRRTLAFHRTPYDWRAAAAKIRAAGLPEFLAERLERGE